MPKQTEKIIWDTIKRLTESKKFDLEGKGITITEFVKESRKMGMGVSRTTIYNLEKRKGSIISEWFKREGKQLILKKEIDSFYSEQITQLIDFYYDSIQDKNFSEACTTLTHLEKKYNEHFQKEISFHKIFENFYGWRNYLDYYKVKDEYLIAPELETAIKRKKDYRKDRRYCSFCFEEISGPCYILHGEEWPDYIWDEINWNLYNFIHPECFVKMFQSMAYEKYFPFRLNISPDIWDPHRHLCPECHLDLFEVDKWVKGKLQIKSSKIIASMSEEIRVEFLELVYELGGKDIEQDSTEQREENDKEEKSLVDYFIQYSDHSLAFAMQYADQHYEKLSSRQKALFENYYLLKDELKEKFYEKIEKTTGSFRTIKFTFDENRYQAPVSVFQGKVYHRKCADRVAQRHKLFKGEGYS